MFKMFTNVIYIVFCVCVLISNGDSSDETTSETNSTNLDIETTPVPHAVLQDTDSDSTNDTELVDSVTTVLPLTNDTEPPEIPNTTTNNSTENVTTPLPVDPPLTTPPEDNTTTTTKPPDIIITKYLDESTFLGGLNGWDFYGMWGKYNLANSLGKTSSIPDIPTSKDHVVLFTMDADGSLLQKDFPPMFNSTVSLTYYVNCTGKSFIASKVESSSTMDILFNISGDALEDVNWRWFTNTYENTLQYVPFKVKFSFKSEKSNCFWAIDVITVRGIQTSEEVTDIPTEAPPNNSSEATTPLTPDEPKNVTENSTTAPVVSTTPNVTLNQTTTSASQVSNSTPPPEDTTTTTTTTTVTPNDAVQEIASIASAIWDAFYVFLALFCACLIALIVLIVRQRNREEEPMPPTVAAYSPRTSSYQLEKARDNPGYQTDSV